MKPCFQAYIAENVLITLGWKSRQQIKQFKFFAGFYLTPISMYFYLNNHMISWSNERYNSKTLIKLE
jgi:hypothetical protein